MQPARLWDGWLVPLGTIILAAWVLLALGGSVSGWPAFCSADIWRAMPLSASLDLALLSNAIPKSLLGWVLMVVAMMLPLAISPLRHVRERSFARRRTRSMLLFVAGFIAVWMAGGVVLETIAWMMRSALTSPFAAIGLSALVALVWQVSPAKQWCLNRCHQRPPLSAFGLAADVDAFGFGVTNGGACVGAGWALMMPMLLIGQGQMPAMVAVTLFGIAESLESPSPLAWRWRGGAKALRILAAWWPTLPERSVS